MNVDSRIAEFVHHRFTEQWAPCLCIHDIFIVAQTRTLELVEVMKTAATHVVGGPLRISQDYPGLDQFLSSPSGYTVADYYRWRRLPGRSAGYLHRLAQ